MIRNIVFDMGMVLLRYEPLIACLRYAQGDREKALRLKAAIFDSPDWIKLDSGDLTEEGLAPLAQARLEDEAERCLHRGDHVLATHDAHNAVMRPLAGMEQLVADLHDRGYRLYILSNAGHRFRTYEYKLPHPEYLSGILVSAEERMIKPDPRIFLRLCDKFSLKPEECLFIDDSAANVQGAESTGMTGYCFADGDVARLRAYLDGLTK